MLIGRTPTSQESYWLELCQQLSCIVCERFHGVPDSPCEVHHLRGKTDPDAHLDTISLCTRHHRVSDNHHPKRWISRHGDGKRLFEARYAPEKQLLEWQRDRALKLEENRV